MKNITPEQAIHSPLESAIFKGWVRHRRFFCEKKGELIEQPHEFRYKVFMMFIRLDEIEQVLALSPLWSTKGLAPAKFSRKDFFGDPEQPLEDCVRDKVNQELKEPIDGPIFMLSNFRYFGYITNPLTVYYCYNKAHQLQALLLEVTNTPWGERQQYVIPCDPNKQKLRTQFNKAMHVSPFNPMNMQYHWYSNTPGKSLMIHMQNKLIEDNQSTGNPVFDATLQLQREDISTESLNQVLYQYPMMTAKVISAIYWQALKLWFKKTPLYTHPDKLELASQSPVTAHKSNP